MRHKSIERVRQPMVKLQNYLEFWILIWDRFQMMIDIDRINSTHLTMTI